MIKEPNTVSSDCEYYERPYLIGITGGTASGKTTFTEKIFEDLNFEITKFSFDCFYKGLPPNTDPDNYDFDHPESLDFEEILRCFRLLRDGKECNLPVYSFITHKREKDTVALKPKKIIIFEGIHAFYNKEIRDSYDLKIFVYCDTDIALCRRVIRDINERGRDVYEVLQRYNKFVKIDYDKYISPLMKYANFMVPGFGDNDEALNLVKNYILKKGLRLDLKTKKNNNDNSIIVLNKFLNLENLLQFIIANELSDDELFDFIKPMIKSLFKKSIAYLELSNGNINAEIIDNKFVLINNKIIFTLFNNKDFNEYSEVTHIICLFSEENAARILSNKKILLFFIYNNSNNLNKIRNNKFLNDNTNQYLVNKLFK